MSGIPSVLCKTQSSESFWNVPLAEQAALWAAAHFMQGSTQCPREQAGTLELYSGSGDSWFMSLSPR